MWIALVVTSTIRIRSGGGIVNILKESLFVIILFHRSYVCIDYDISQSWVAKYCLEKFVIDVLFFPL